MRTGFAFAAAAAAVLQLGAQSPGEVTPQSGTPTAPPKLVVLLVIDQFRADYVDMYGKQWTQGLHEIFTKGAHFTEAAYPYSMTSTCPGHSTIGTGTLPSTHGMVGNEWFDPTTREFVTCTEDPSAESLAYGGGRGVEHHSAQRLLVPTFADELKRQSRRPARVVSLSVKPRSAIGMGGHGGANTIFMWEEDLGGVWATSNVMTRGLSREVSAYVKAHPIAAARGEAWNRVLPESAYLFDDKAPGEPSDATFPHALIEPIRTSRTTATFVDVWDRTPLVDAFLGDLGATLVEQLELGQRDATDMLAIGFSGLDIVGHPYGPRSHEVQDTMARVDQVIGRLIATLDRTVGRDRYVLALSADHGVAIFPEQVEPASTAGRLASTLPIGTAVEAVLDKAFGPGRYVDAMSNAYLYFYPGVLGRIQSAPEVMKAIETAAIGVRGVASAHWAADLAATSPTDDPLVAKLRKSYMAGRSGDLAYVLLPNWISGATGTNHGSPYPYDARVPVAFLGGGIAPGRYTTAATPVDIVPTLATLTGVVLPRTDGRVLGEAIRK